MGRRSQAHAAIAAALALHTSLMQADAVGDSTQGNTASPLVPQTAPSDDCSAITLGTSTALDCAMSFPVQHAQHGPAQLVAAQDTSIRHQTAAEDASIAPNPQRLLRKRKQPDRSCPPPSQAQSKQSQLHSNPRNKGNISDGKVKNDNKPASIVQMLSYRQGKQKGSEASEGQSSLEGSQGSIRSVPASSGTSAGRKGKAKSKYNAVIGRTVDIPAPIFSVDIPDLYYRGTVLKKDPAHPGSVVVRFIEDGSRYWFPLAEVERFLKDMQSKGRDAASGTIGQGSHAFAAQVLAGTLAAKKKASGMTSSSATAGNTAGSHEVEVSSCVHSNRAQVRSPSRLGRKAATSNAEEEASSLQTLAAAADSGDI